MSEYLDQEPNFQDKGIASALYVGDADTDFMTTWDTVWQPSASDDCIKEFVTCFDNGDSSRYGVVNLKGLAKYLKKVNPHIDWRIKTDGCDDDYGGGRSWDVIAVPGEQYAEAETIISRIEKSVNIKIFTVPKDFFPQLYDDHRELRLEIVNFALSFSKLYCYYSSKYHQHSTNTRQEQENQIMHLMDLLADLYAAGSRLCRIKGIHEFIVYPNFETPTDFQDYMLEIYGQYLVGIDDPFERIAYACEFNNMVIAKYDNGTPYDVALAVTEWQFGFSTKGGWARSILDALKSLHEILYDIRHYKEPMTSNSGMPTNFFRYDTGREKEDLARAQTNKPEYDGSI